MRRGTGAFRGVAIGLLAVALIPAVSGEVVVADSGPRTSIARPGAPKHIVGLPRTIHGITMDTGRKTYGLRYVIAHDPKRPGVAIPGEGYIGMPQPSSCNWYAGGFFDLQINGSSIGTTPIQSFVGHRDGRRGHVDFVFDTKEALVRIRFSTVTGGDALFCQTVLEPKRAITALRLVLRCYPSAYVSASDRHVLTPVRDVAQGKSAVLDSATEWWLLYYDRVFDAGHATPNRTGRGSCSVLWPDDQADRVAFTVGSYGTDTVMDLQSSRREFRFVFFDYRGTKNEDAMADLRARAGELKETLRGFSFTAESIRAWPLEKKKKEIAGVLATMQADDEAVARYQAWGEELRPLLQTVRDNAPGRIEAEAKATEIIRKWEEGIPALRLKALLDKI